MRTTIKCDQHEKYSVSAFLQFFIEKVIFVLYFQSWPPLFEGVELYPEKKMEQPQVNLYDLASKLSAITLFVTTERFLRDRVPFFVVKCGPITVTYKSVPRIYGRSFCVSGKEVDTWPLMSNPLPVIGIVAAYLYFVLKLGPALMKNREPLNIKPVMLAYNLYQTLSNAHIVLLVRIISTFSLFELTRERNISSHILSIFS